MTCYAGRFKEYSGILRTENFVETYYYIIENKQQTVAYMCGAFGETYVIYCMHSVSFPAESRDLHMHALV